MEKLVKKIRISAIIELITGLHIGGNGENIEIGGIDNSVIKLAIKDKQPYIPGSSLKGKIRCLLEQIEGSSEVGGNDKINNLFGYSEKKILSKLIVRDAYLTEDSADKLRKCDSLDMPYTEAKFENVINRVSGTSDNLRQTERVPAGVNFKVEFILNIWDTDGDGSELLNLLKQGMNALENDYLGGSGTRGYGQIKFHELEYAKADNDSNWEMKKLIGL